MSTSLLEQVVGGCAPGLISLTIDQYHQMIDAGILREGEPIELIDGFLVRKDRSDRGKTPLGHGPRHSLALKWAERKLRLVEAQGWHIRVQLPVTLSSLQEPEPDLAVVKGRPEDYVQHHPAPGHIRLLIEVSDTSLTFDRTTKQRIYAAADIALYWIINLAEGQVEVYREPLPGEGRYAVRTDFRPGQSVQLELAANQLLDLAVADLLPPEA
jgi:Uma2 family endonuclease